jgi:alpha-amylase
MADDLGDRHTASLQQGGALPNNSLDCRVAGRIFAQSGEEINVELYPADTLRALTVILLDKDCQPVDSTTGAGALTLQYVPTQSGWYTLRVRNATATQPGQKCWVKVTYQAPTVVQTNVAKQKCACVNTIGTSVAEESLLQQAVRSFPNPVTDQLYLVLDAEHWTWHLAKVKDLQGRLIMQHALPKDAFESQLNVEALPAGMYLLEVQHSGGTSVQRFIKQ